MRFESEPGRQLRTTEWTQIAGHAVDVHFVVSPLSYSRRFHFWGTDSKDTERTCQGLVRAFEWFGGVPAQVLVDNQKCAVIAHRRDEAPQLCVRFVDLAGHYDFVPRASWPARAQSKGKDERDGELVKRRFFVRCRAFGTWAHLDQLAEQWLRDGADPSVQDTVLGLDPAQPPAEPAQAPAPGQAPPCRRGVGRLAGAPAPASGPRPSCRATSGGAGRDPP